MHTVDEVHVGMTRWAVHGLVARGAPTGGMASSVVLANVGLHFCDQARETLAVYNPHQPLAQQFLRHRQGASFIEIPSQSAHQSSRYFSPCTISSTT